jgi:hypothetical protein
MAARSEQCDRMSDGLRPGLSRTSSVVAGDPLPANCELIEVHVSELAQLFDAIDPSPFRERDLDPHAEEFITDWANEAAPGALPSGSPFSWIGWQDWRMNRRSSGKPSTDSSVTTRNSRDGVTLRGASWS